MVLVRIMFSLLRCGSFAKSSVETAVCFSNHSSGFKVSNFCFIISHCSAQIFLKNADKVITQIPSATELRNFWVKQCEVLKQKFDSLKPEEWFEKHTAVSAEDFAKEPHRNKLNIILTRTTHLQYHLGQLVLLK